MGFLAPSPPALPAVASAPPPVFAGGPVQGMKPGAKIQQATNITPGQMPTRTAMASPSLMGTNPSNTGQGTLLGG
jgi:hypothetical protein